jgi:drug/metabolite transporter (DMT)-like permease
MKRLSPLVAACLAATWLVWGSTYLAIKFALISFPPFFQMGTRFLAAGGILFLWTAVRGLPLDVATSGSGLLRAPRKEDR